MIASQHLRSRSVVERSQPTLCLASSLPSRVAILGGAALLATALGCSSSTTTPPGGPAGDDGGTGHDATAAFDATTAPDGWTPGTDGGPPGDDSGSTAPPTDALGAGEASSFPDVAIVSPPPLTGPDGGPLGFAVTTNRYDNARNGANLYETTLNVANVSGPTFGRKFALPVQGHIYAQPLYLPNLTINGSVHNVIFVATELNNVYAFDADTAGAALWTVSLGTPVQLRPSTNAYNKPLSPGSNTSCRDMYPHVGITSTPVIDRATGRLYVVAKTEDSSGVFAQRLHALDVLTGMD
ncbi:MAG: hypothetical protein M3O50_02735, partial [Myxococcota bacterium]|nr:hypothetical protein [Myxococcota bacterium]